MQKIAVTAALAALKFFGQPTPKVFSTAMTQVIKVATKVLR